MLHCSSPWQEARSQALVAYTNFLGILLKITKITFASLAEAGIGVVGDMWEEMVGCAIVYAKMPNHYSSVSDLQ